MLWNSKISQLENLVFTQEDVQAFDVSVNNVIVMEELNSFAKLVAVVPEISFADILLPHSLLFQNLKFIKFIIIKFENICNLLCINLPSERIPSIYEGHRFQQKKYKT